MTFYSKSLTTYCGLATYKCQKCTEEFTCLLKLAVHLNGEHERINNRSQCPICPKNYHKNFTKVTNHIKSVHLNVKKKCKICQEIVPFRCEIFGGFSPLVPSKREKNILVLLSLYIFWGKCVYSSIFEWWNSQMFFLT